MFRWKLIGILSTALIVIAIPLSIVKHHYRMGRFQPVAAADFIGTEKCRTCHQPEYELWKGSNHDHAMEVASEATVCGDFNDATFERFGIVSRFYRKDNKFFVHTQGPEGVMGDFEIIYTFGWNPLQQYLVPFPGGRMQCLPIAWDVKGRRWYHLYPDQPIAPKDWQYWTNATLNWNGMCAACHSTNLKKNYHVQVDTYQTTWSDINVGCKACHGPGSRHVKWAELPDMDRPAADNFDLAVRTSGLKSCELVGLAHRVIPAGRFWGITPISKRIFWIPCCQACSPGTCTFQTARSWMRSMPTPRSPRARCTHGMCAAATAITSTASKARKRRQQPVTSVPPGKRLRHLPASFPQEEG